MLLLLLCMYILVRIPIIGVKGMDAIKSLKKGQEAAPCHHDLEMFSKLFWLRLQMFFTSSLIYDESCRYRFGRHKNPRNDPCWSRAALIQRNVQHPSIMLPSPANTQQALPWCADMLPLILHVCLQTDAGMVLTHLSGAFKNMRFEDKREATR